MRTKYHICETTGGHEWELDGLVYYCHGLTHVRFRCYRCGLRHKRAPYRLTATEKLATLRAFWWWKEETKAEIARALAAAQTPSCPAASERSR